MCHWRQHSQPPLYGFTRNFVPFSLLSQLFCRTGGDSGHLIYEAAICFEHVKECQ